MTGQWKPTSGFNQRALAKKSHISSYKVGQGYQAEQERWPGEKKRVFEFAGDLTRLRRRIFAKMAEPTNLASTLAAAHNRRTEAEEQAARAQAAGRRAISSTAGEFSSAEAIESVQVDAMVGVIAVAQFRIGTRLKAVLCWNYRSP